MLIKGAQQLLSTRLRWLFTSPIGAKIFSSRLRLNAVPAAAHAGGGAATANGDATHNYHANGGRAGAAVRLGRIGCGGDLGQRKGGRSGGPTLGGRAGCTEKVQSLTGGGASGVATTNGRGEGGTEGSARAFACLANGGGHVDSASHGRGEGCPEGGAPSSADASRGTATYSRAVVCAVGGGVGKDHRGTDGAVAILSELSPKPTLEH
jgi:hypothetical protein